MNQNENEMKKLLKILESIVVVPFCIAFGLIAALLAFIFVPIYFCDIVLQDIWME